MSEIDRRTFLLHAGALSLSLCGLSGCAKPPSRADVLADLVRKLAVPDLRAVALYSKALSSQAEALRAKPSTTTLRNTQDAWRRALIAWKRVYAFREGPVVDSSALLRASFWPARTRGIDELLQASAQPLDDAAVEELGVDLKGMFGLETLLFSQDGEKAVQARLAHPHDARPRELVAAFARHISRYADAANQVLGSGESFATKYAAAGQESLNRLVNQMVVSIESLGLERLQLVLDHAAAGTLKLHEVEGGLSGTSHVILQTVLAAHERLYLGHEGLGLSSLVMLGSHEIDERLRTAFRQATLAANAIDVSLERAAREQRGRLEAASRVVKDLEVRLKTDLVSALGVTLTFTAGDGD